MKNGDAARDRILHRLEGDLIGPMRSDEWIDDRPSDRYLTGILFPKNTKIGAEDDDQSETETSDAEASGSDVGVTLHNTIRPSTAGVSFTLESDSETPSVDVTIDTALYLQEERPESESRATDAKIPEESERGAVGSGGLAWHRRPIHVEFEGLEIPVGSSEVEPDRSAVSGLLLHTRCVRSGQQFLVTVALVNTLGPVKGRAETEEASFFQVDLTVKPAVGTRIVRRRQGRSPRDDDGRIADLIYREAEDFAVGHTCSARWSLQDSESASEVGMAWIPRVIVPAMSPEGDRIFSSLKDGGKLEPLSTRWAEVASDKELVSGLALLPEAYETWLNSEEKKTKPQDESSASLSHSQATQARENLETARLAVRRMRQAVELLDEDKDVRKAFRLAARAMRRQRNWSRGDEDLVWRPFQLGFQLLTLASTAVGEHDDRRTMDLLWFPTGGGKTEAYLGLTAFTFFLRRLRDPSEGAGVSVLMRYTLRALTIDQFQRATALVAACESVRREEARNGGNLGTQAFGIGLWVGGSATPNTVRQAATEAAESNASHKQIRDCPACGGPVRWSFTRSRTDILCGCESDDCEFSERSGGIPVWTVDELVYEHRPSLIIGTVDKFAQITRKAEAGLLLGVGVDTPPPELIIQDELHLISGPLGTLTALYEIAIDELCTREGVPPKIIGSTATIRRAGEQIRSLFNRSTYQFPSPVIDSDNSCFAVVDRDAPGRLYAAVSTVGRSPKFTLQAVSASLLQSAASPDLGEEERDPYWTMVGYFNALRELGGALVLMEDDVRYSIQGYARRRGEDDSRELSIIEELTSRRDTEEIQGLLSDLKVEYGTEGCVDILLASSMISVGVDVPRLGMMVMNGQPKSVSEYIQATSRVGRGDTPGLIVSIYNNSRVRDRAYYETFPVWHNALYRDVEATSVTPFASRALDRALHAVLVALVRHRVAGMREQPTLDGAKRAACRSVAQVITERAAIVDPSAVDEVQQYLENALDRWEAREGLEHYWNDYGGRDHSLLISAEQAAALGAVGADPGAARPTPNSMREVEPSVDFYLATRPWNAGGGGDDTEA